MKQLLFGALLIAAVLTIGSFLSPAFAGTKGHTEKNKTITVDGATLVYRVYGDKGGTPLVLLSPLGFSLDDWDPAVVNGLAKFSTVIVFDNKGVGPSSGKTPATITEIGRASCRERVWLLV